MTITRMNLRETVPPKIIKSANLNNTMNDLYEVFSRGEEKNAELVNKFFDQPYFKGEESLINKLKDTNPNIDFDYIKDEGINLALLLDKDLSWNFNSNLNKIRSNDIKIAFIQEIYNKIQTALGTTDPYTDFDTKCDVTNFITGSSPNVSTYFEHVTKYLEGKENEEKGKKVIEILKDMNITNEDLNNRLPTGTQIPAGVPLGNIHLPGDTREAFDSLLSFEVGQEADRTIHTVNEIYDGLESLFTNSLPAINTIVGENDDLKFDESKLGSEYKDKLQRIKDNNNLNDEEKNNKINELRRKYYLDYLKKKNSSIGNALQKLYDNNFDYSKLSQPVLDKYLDDITDMRLKALFLSGTKNVLKLNFGNLDSFSQFYRDLAKCSVNTIQLDESRGILLPVKKEIVKGENAWLKDIDKFGKSAKSYDVLPITYTFKKRDIDNLPIDVEDKVKLLNFLSRFKSDENNYIVEGGDIGKLIYLFFAINSRTPITSLDPDKQKEVANLFSNKSKDDEKPGEENQEGKNNNNNENNENSENNENNENNNENKNNENNNEGENNENNNEGENNENNNEGENNENNDEGENNENNNEDENNKEEKNDKETLTPEEFISAFEKLGPGKFENGSEIRVPIGESEIPGGGYQWMKIKISNIDTAKGTFKGTVFGGELKLSSKYEGKSKTFEMNKETLDDFKKISKNVSSSEDKVWLQPNPDKLDFNSFRTSLDNKLGTNTLGFPPEGTTRDGNKFMQKIIDDKGKEKEVEVKYFGAPDDDKSTYKIEYNPIRKSFSVSTTFNGEEKGKNGKPEKKRFSYKRDMDWNNFLIFFTQKGLVPQTEEESNKARRKQDKEFKMVNGGNRKINWFSFNNLKNVFKTIKGNIKKKIDDYNKSQEEKLEDILVGDRGIYNKLAGILGFIPSMKNGLGELQQEYYNERDNRTWKKIEYYLKIFQADPDFGTTFDQVPPFAKILGGKSYKDFITDLAKPGSSRSKDDIHKAAALLLANIEKGSSPYRGLAGQENSGLWVKVLLGPNHYNKFMEDKENCIYDLKKNGKNKDQIQDVLATCEMDYIINNVSGANGKLKYFGSHEDRGIPGKKGTDYVDNYSKKTLSNQFADKLKGTYKGRFDKSAVETAFDGIKHNDFNLAKEDFIKLIKSSRFPGAVANLKKMFMLAKTEEQQAEYQKFFLVYMLSGVLDINGKKDLRKQTYQWAKTMSFLPGMLAKETCHSEKVVTLLEDFCEEKGYGKFSDSIKSYFHEGDLLKGKLNVETLIGELNERWDVDKMKAFEKYSKSDFPSKNFAEGSVLSELKKDLLKSDMENIDTSLLDNPLVANSGGLLSNINVVHNRIDIKDGEFSGKDNDEIENKRKFRNKIADEVKDTQLTVENTELLLKQYCERFQIHDKEKTYRRIKTAYERKNRIGRHAEFKNNDNTRDDMGEITQHEIDSIIWYTFQGTAMSEYFGGHRLPTEMKKVLKAFQDFFKSAFDNNILKDPKIVSKTFNIENEGNIKPLLLGSWDRYNETVTGKEYTIDDDKKEKSRVKNHFIGGNFINHDIAALERRLKNLSSGDYKSVTKSDLDTLVDRYRDAA